MIRVTRFNSEGKVHHTTVVNEVPTIDYEDGKLFLDMDVRYWVMLDEGRFEIEAV